MNALLLLNKEAPNFSLPDQNGKIHSLKNYRGKWTLIYFYPKDDTPGCTKEACSIKDNFYSFKEVGAIILGISADSIQNHSKFSIKYELPFTLLSDENKEVIKKYGAWGRKKFMGKEYQGILRTSFLISPKGIIVKVYEKVNPIKHASEVLEDLNNFKK